MTEKRKPMTAARKARILNAHDGKCYRCDKEFEAGDKVEFDHKLALARGGTDDDENIGPCHAHCHALKTFGGNTKLGADIYEIAKTKRMKAKHEGTHKKRKHKWPKGKLKSRNTLSDNRYKKKLDGTVERRDAQ